jgi:uncharacterized protein
MASTPTSRKKVVIATVLTLLLLAGVAYGAFGYIIYTKLANVTTGCEKFRANRPDHFELIVAPDDKNPWPELDVTPYFMPQYEAVSFPSRQADLSISGWFVPGEASAPVVVVIEGINSCKYAQAALIPAGMLHKHGFNVLLIDPRDMGDSDLEDGYSAIGNEEYLDVLGAWDWLIAEKGFTPERIGVYGNSLGAATVLIASQFEPGVAAIFLNSPFSNLSQIIGEELQRGGYPKWLVPSAILAARLVSGDDLLAHSPEDAIRAAGTRPVFIVHSRDDERINVRHSERLMEVAQEAKVNATVWYVDGARHIRVMAMYPEEFEARLTGFFGDALAGGSTTR